MADNGLAVAGSSPAMVVRDQVNKIQELMNGVLQDGQHYGKIPGCGDKPTLLQPGAEKIALMFGWAASYDVSRESLVGGHREYDVTCNLTSRDTGALVGSGIGLCSTMESKYRYRRGDSFELTGDPIPQDAKQKKAEYRRQGFGMKKVDGQWEWVRYLSEGRDENPDIADTYNTVLKMAKKRALVDAVKSTAAASDIFTQDIEDLPQQADPRPVAATVQPAPAVDLGPVRSRFKAYTSAIGLTPQGAAAALCKQVGATDMQGMTSEQVEKAVALMDGVTEQVAEYEAAGGKVELADEEMDF